MMFLTNMNESCHAYESCLTYEWLVCDTSRRREWCSSPTWTSHVTHMSHIYRMNDSIVTRPRRKLCFSPTWTSHVTHMSHIYHIHDSFLDTSRTHTSWTQQAEPNRGGVNVETSHVIDMNTVSYLKYSFVTHMNDSFGARHEHKQAERNGGRKQENDVPVHHGRVMSLTWIMSGIWMTYLCHATNTASSTKWRLRTKKWCSSPPCPLKRVSPLPWLALLALFRWYV